MTIGTEETGRPFTSSVSDPRRDSTPYSSDLERPNVTAMGA